MHAHGDNEQTAAAVAKKLDHRVMREVSKMGAFAFIKAEHAAGRKSDYGWSGVTDAPALSEPDVGTAVNEGAG